MGKARIREIRRLQNITLTNFDGRDADIFGNNVKCDLQRKSRLRLTSTTIRGKRRFICSNAKDLHHYVRYRVGTFAIRSNDFRCDDPACEHISADIDDQAFNKCSNMAILVIAKSNFSIGSARVGRCLHMLDPILNPFDRLTEQFARI